jgi:hypothetical protein
MIRWIFDLRPMCTLMCVRNNRLIPMFNTPHEIHTCQCDFRSLYVSGTVGVYTRPGLQ